MRVASLIALLALTVPADARCLSKREADATYPRTHLYWSVGKNGKCWETSLARARVAAKGPSSPAPVVPVQRDPLWIITPGKYPTPPIQTSPTQLEDYPQWQWITKAREAEREAPKEGEGVVYSTFVGEPPDVWPPLDKEQPLIIKLITMMLLMILSSTVIATIWRFYNQHRNKLWMMIRRGSPPYHDMFTRL
jgi:hypothetical protein